MPPLNLQFSWGRFEGWPKMWRGRLEVNGLWTRNECVQHRRTRRVCLYLCGFLLKVCVWLVQECDWCYINLGMIVCEFRCVRTNVYISVCVYTWVYLCLSPAPSLGRRQSQCWGCSSAAPAASRANLGGEKHFDPGLQVWGSPAGGSAALQSILDLFLSHLQAPHTPQRGSLNCTLSVSLDNMLWYTHEYT